MGYFSGHSWLVARTRIRVIGVDFDKGKRKFSSIQWGIQVIRILVNQVKMTEKWAEIQGKWDLVRVSGEVQGIQDWLTRVLLQLRVHMRSAKSSFPGVGA